MPPWHFLAYAAADGCWAADAADDHLPGVLEVGAGVARACSLYICDQVATLCYWYQ